MQFRFAIPFLLLLMSFTAHAFELIMVQAVSESKRTFVTRTGKRQGTINGMTATFTAEDVSILAKAITVTGNFTQWEIINPEVRMPFEKGAIVTYYPATEYIWALAPEEERKKYIKSHVPVLHRSITVKGGLLRGVNESVSDAPAANFERGGIQGEIYYEKEFTPQIALGAAIRYDEEIVNYGETTFITKRNVLMVDMVYYFDAFKEYLSGKFYTALGVGYGASSTETIGLKQAGVVGILPGLRFGLTFPINPDWTFITEAGLESLQTKEEQSDGREQTTTQTNFRSGIGLRRFF